MFSLPTISVGHIVGAHKGLAVQESCGTDGSTGIVRGSESPWAGLGTSWEKHLGQYSTCQSLDSSEDRPHRKSPAQP